MIPSPSCSDPDQLPPKSSRHGMALIQLTTNERTVVWVPALAGMTGDGGRRQFRGGP